MKKSSRLRAGSSFFDFAPPKHAITLSWDFFAGKRAAPSQPKRALSKRFAG
jgi:hypothetical protein